MPKAYIIARVDISDPEAYARYAAGATEAQKQYGARVLARGGRHEPLEGPARARNVVLEFENVEAARTYYFSQEYQSARKHREGAAVMEMVLVEGVGP